MYRDGDRVTVAISPDDCVLLDEDGKRIGAQIGTPTPAGTAVT